MELSQKTIRNHSPDAQDLSTTHLLENIHIDIYNNAKLYRYLESTRKSVRGCKFS